MMEHPGKVLALIRRKAKHRRKERQTRGWTRSSTLIALAGLVLSLFGNVVQYQSARSQKEIAKQQLQLKKTQWIDEKKKLRLEIKELQKTSRRDTEDREKVLGELERVNRDIDVWDNGIFNSNIKLMFLKSELSRYEATDKKAMVVDVTRKNIKLEEEFIATKTREKESLVLRRRELEQRLGELR